MNPGLAKNEKGDENTLTTRLCHQRRNNGAISAVGLPEEYESSEIQYVGIGVFCLFGFFFRGEGWGIGREE